MNERHAGHTASSGSDGRLPVMRAGGGSPGSFTEYGWANRGSLYRRRTKMPVADVADEVDGGNGYRAATEPWFDNARQAERFPVRPT